MAVMPPRGGTPPGPHGGGGAAAAASTPPPATRRRVLPGGTPLSGGDSRAHDDGGTDDDEVGDADGADGDASSPSLLALPSPVARVLRLPRGAEGGGEGGAKEWGGHGHGGQHDERVVARDAAALLASPTTALVRQLLASLRVVAREPV